MDNELELVEKYIDETRQGYEQRSQLRQLNLQENIKYSNDSYLEALDSSIKRNSAFVKRLRSISDVQKCQILDEIDKLNLTKFISEVATSLVETKIKLCDIPTVIEICTKLNRLYKDFHVHLLAEYVKYLPTLKRARDSGPTSKLSSKFNQSATRSGPNDVLPRSSSQLKDLSAVQQTVAKLRVDVRLFGELILCGILPLKTAFQHLYFNLQYLTQTQVHQHQYAGVVLTFCKGCGDEMLGLVPENIRQLASKYDKVVPSSDYIMKSRQELICTIVVDYHRNLRHSLNHIHDELKDLVAKHQKIGQSKGEISKDVRDMLDARNAEYQKLHNIISNLDGILGLNSPELLSSELDAFDVHIQKLSNNQANTPTNDANEDCLSQSGTSSVWDDDGTRSFYEELIDLKDFYPHLQVKANLLKKRSDESLDSLKLTADIGEKSPDNDNGTTTIKEEDDSTTDSSSSPSIGEEVNITTTEKHSPKVSVANKTRRRGCRSSLPDQYFTKLSDCVNRDMIDNAAVDFIKFFNTKFGRKKLIKTLINVQRTRLDLLPFFARLTATLYPYVPCIGNDIAAQLKAEFRFLFKKKDQINIESKIKNARYIGEFTKFNLIQKQDAVDCLKMLLTDFTHHHIEMTCNILETCGRLLYKSFESNHQLKLILEQVMRKKMLLSIDSKYVTMIENAYYTTNPPEVIKRVINEPDMQAYVRYLLYQCLNRSTIDKVVKKLLLLDWNDKLLAKFVINRMIEAHHVKFYNIRYFAALLATLNRNHPWLSIAVVDGVVEDILLMMEINEVQFNQRRIPMIRYFGELYNYKLSDSSLVFKILYSLITYGVIYPDPSDNIDTIETAQLEFYSSHLDPLDSLFRIKLICDLLDTSGPYLNGSQEKRKLDCYLLFFQRYYWCKKHIFTLAPFCMAKSNNQWPASMEYLYNDTIYNLRPNFQMATTYGDAVSRLEDFMSSLS